MALDDDIAILARVALFSELDDEQLRLLAFGAEPLDLAAGRWLCREGQIADGGFILTSGSLASVSADGTVLSRHGAPGTLVGEVSLIARVEWHASIIADTACTLLRLPRPLFRRILEEFPAAAAAMRNRLAADIAESVTLMERAARKFP
jgi:CRP-like cAMP-binding protein